MWFIQVHYESPRDFNMEREEKRTSLWEVLVYKNKITVHQRVKCKRAGTAAGPLWTLPNREKATIKQIYLAVPLSSLLLSTPPCSPGTVAPTEAEPYPFAGWESGGALVTTRSMVTEDWGGLWSRWMGWTWPPPPGTKARAFPKPEGRIVGCGGAAMMTGWALTGDPTKRAIKYSSWNTIHVNASCMYFNAHLNMRARSPGALWEYLYSGTAASLFASCSWWSWGMGEPSLLKHSGVCNPLDGGERSPWWVGDAGALLKYREERWWDEDKRTNVEVLHLPEPSAEWPIN